MTLFEKYLDLYDAELKEDFNSDSAKKLFSVIKQKFQTNLAVPALSNIRKKYDPAKAGVSQAPTQSRALNLTAAHFENMKKKTGSQVVLKAGRVAVHEPVVEKKYNLSTEVIDKVDEELLDETVLNNYRSWLLMSDNQLLDVFGVLAGLRNFTNEHLLKDSDYTLPKNSSLKKTVDVMKKEMNRKVYGNASELLSGSSEEE